MLLINKILLEMSKGIRGWMFIITCLKLLIMFATIEFTKIIALFLGDLFNPAMTTDDFISAVISALIMSLILVVGNVLLGKLNIFALQEQG